MQEQWIIQLRDILEQSLTLQTKEGRDDIVNQLSADIRGNINRRETVRADIEQIIITCNHYEGGIQQLLGRLEDREKGSITVKKAKALIAPVPDEPPAPPATKEPILINQKTAQQLFLELVERKQSAHILWMQGDPKMGKSYLVKQLRQHLRGQQHLTALARLDDARNAGRDIFRELYQQLGRPHFSRYLTKLEKVESESKNEREERYLTMEHGRDKRDEPTPNELLTIAFADDLIALAEKEERCVVLFLDAFDQAPATMQQWLTHEFLGSLCGVDQLLTVVTSRHAPPDRPTWGDYCRTHELTRYSQDDYREYCRVNNYQIRDVWIEGYHRGGKGNLGDFAEYAPTLHEGKI